MPTADAVAKAFAPLVFQALRDIGKNRVSDADVARLRRLLPEKDRKELLKNIRYAPGWMQPVVKAVAQDEEAIAHG